MYVLQTVVGTGKKATINNYVQLPFEMLLENELFRKFMVKQNHLLRIAKVPKFKGKAKGETIMEIEIRVKKTMYRGPKRKPAVATNDPLSKLFMSEFDIDEPLPGRFDKWKVKKK